ncbi:uncharacterized protein N7482_009397 [Penicillium canariense]|uniref:DNA2/NAM7 helicase-like C-terminal domain-containing protein n=1 Tax=Penicillium canariense TaxID=189055 RepID=A0A9W9LFP4_9EURO|nr:uncharacterized protein N7482_009397 [Penicillium canariense]KAJ5152919.1 hypothetical protein N7482_009397 [Penicillium canariense]
MDYPKELHGQLKRKRHCTVSVSGGNEHIRAFLKICLDSQQPRLDLRIGDAHLVFPATQTEMDLVTKGVSAKSDAFIQANQKAALPEMKNDHMGCFLELSPSAEPICAGPFWKLGPEDMIRWKKLQQIEWSGKKVFIWISHPIKDLAVFKEVRAYMIKIVKLVRESFAAGGEPHPFWFAEQNPLPKEGTANRRPKMLWLFNAEGDYNTLETPDSFFLDDRDRRERLVEAAVIEQHVQWAMYDGVFQTGQKHQASLELVTPKENTWKLHIWMNADPKPAPPEGIPAKYEIDINPFPGKDSKPFVGQGICVGSGLADFAILTRAQLTPTLNGQSRQIEVTVKVNLKSSNAQIEALVYAGRATSFGDSTKHDGNGFSMQRTILAHRSELDPSNPHYFEINCKECSIVPGPQQLERVDYILNRYPLDPSQKSAVDKALFKVVAGIHLIKGPPGTGKTRTILVMTLILASLDLRVLICGGSDTAVDNLLHTFHLALKEDARLRGWAKELYRAQPQNKAEQQAKKLIDMLDDDRPRVLGRDETKALVKCYEDVLALIIGKCKVVATTLNSPGEEALRISKFEPFALLCDEAGQCLEADTMIAMNWQSLRLNEWTKYHGRSLMARLEWCYPLSTLEVNYRCHPDILAWSAQAIYRGKIAASPINSAPDRVGNAWDSFTASRHHFKVQKLIRKRRLLINAPGKAFQPPGSTSWQNDDHINVVIDLLRALYAHGSTGNRILPQDVMLICPYKAQVKRVVERFGAEGVQYHRCLTVDSAQGSESNVVLFMLTKPRTNSVTEVGFLSDYRRLNVALTRAKKLMVAVGNLTIGNADFVRKASGGSSRYLAGFLKDVIEKRDVLNWVGAETVERVVGSNLQQQMPASSPALRPKVVPPPAGMASMETALAANAEYRDLVQERARLAVEKGELDRSRIELDALEAGVLQRIAANARDLEEYEVMWKRKLEGDHP